MGRSPNSHLAGSGGRHLEFLRSESARYRKVCDDAIAAAAAAAASHADAEAALAVAVTENKDAEAAVVSGKADMEARKQRAVVELAELERRAVAAESERAALETRRARDAELLAQSALDPQVTIAVSELDRVKLGEVKTLVNPPGACSNGRASHARACEASGPPYRSYTGVPSAHPPTRPRIRTSTLTSKSQGSAAGGVALRGSFHWRHVL